MTNRSLAQPAPPSTTRVQRGRDLYAAHADEIRFEHGSWFVPSATVEGRFYAVRLGPVERCECRDHEHRGAKSTTCDCCGNRVPWRFVSEVTEDDELLSWFVGDRLCADCVNGGFWG